MVDLLEQHCQPDGRMEPTGFIEHGEWVAVEMTVRKPSWHGEAATGTFKVFRFEDEHAVLLQDCTDRDDALDYLADD